MSAAAFDLGTLWLAARRDASLENVSTANGTQVHPNSTHFESLATCLRDFAATAAILAVEQDTSRMTGVSGDAIVISKSQAIPSTMLLPGHLQDACGYDQI